MLQDPYTTKAVEYLLGLTFLVLFVAFWRYATGGNGVGRERAERRRHTAPSAQRSPSS